MKLKEKILAKLTILDRFLDRKLKNVSFPGFKGRSIYHVGKFFAKGLFQEDLNLRASSLAFNFFIAIFPLIIFLFTLIPYIPIENLEGLITGFIQKFLPANAFEFLNETIQDIVTTEHAGLLSFGFIAALYFASNGFASMISAFDSGLDAKMQRNWFDVRLKSTLLLILVVSILLTTISLSIFFTYGVDVVDNQVHMNDQIARFLLTAVEYILTVSLIYFIFSSLYYFGSNKGTEWRFFSIGSTLGTILSIITTYGFRLYVENFNSYNKLYGSVGTLLVLLILIYVNCFVVLIGFELNRSIDKAG
ncbi:MAG: YihY/virulence factor BrkB family protein [Bacteroidia bacterium]